MEDKNFKKRNVVVLIFEILLIAIAVGGLTLATSSLIGSSKTNLKFGEYYVDYVGRTEIVTTGLEPISDSLVGFDSTENVIRLEFSLRGVDTNENPENLIYDIMINDINIDCSLLNEYTKWNLYKEGELISSGNFSPSFDGNILTNNYRLTEIQQKLPLSTDNYDNYVLIVWISEACEDLTSCERVDQSGIVNSSISMNVFVAILGGTPVQYERVPNMDATCVNKPELYDGMLPVYYDMGDWKIADNTNSDVDSKWYDYGDSRWANAVFVNNDKYKDSKVGTVILQEDVLGYYVWIPRYKYKMWNNASDITDSYNALEKGIDIVFESGTNSGQTVKCGDLRCALKANEYLTHPAFSDDLRGFWISKYEISKGNKFVPNVEALRNQKLDDYKNLIGGLSKTYGLEESVDSHIVNNLEWGATLYLSHSKYGVCSVDGCKDILANDTYVSENNKQDTTTRDVYGVYDMAGASPEYVVGNYLEGTGIEEVRIDESTTWYNGNYSAISNDYTLRGGANRGLFFTGDIGMFDVSTRSVLSIKKEDLAS